jgi:hypothetical protein
MKLVTAFGFLATACAAASNPGQAGTSRVQKPDVPGTVFTIVFENENQEDILPVLPFFTKLAAETSQAAAYVSTTHPSLPNYIEMMSGSTFGISNDNDPRFNIQIGGTDNLPDQLDAAGIPWRAYMESMGEPCKLDSVSPLYTAHHNPFLYYTTMISDRVRCEQRDVDFDQSFDADLASDLYRYMWITPNTCNDLHNCDGSVGDEWLQRVAGKIMASPGYQNGGVLFILFDEGSTRYLGAGANLATIVASPQLAETGVVSQTAFDHRSYLATVQDIFRLQRLPTTANATSMDEFFKVE